MFSVSVSNQTRLYFYCFGFRRIPLIAHISDMMCRCRLKRHHSPKCRTQSTTDQTLIDCAITKANNRRNGNGNKQCTEPEITSLLHHNVANCLECKRPSSMTKSNGENTKWKGIYKRRPSGLPLVNRNISEQDTLILQTYSIKRNDKHKNTQKQSDSSVLRELSSSGNDIVISKRQEERSNGYLADAARV